VIDPTSPNHGVVPHTFVDLDGAGVCVCGQARFTGLHVAYDGTPVPDLGGLVEALQVVSDACRAAIELLLGAGAVMEAE
jgi:hypothetical protein